MTNYFLLQSLILALLSCGRESEEPVAVRDEADLVFSSTELDSQESVVPGSYIITFKSELSSSQAFGFPSYLSEYRTHYELIASRHLHDGGVSNIDYLTTEDLSHEFRSVWNQSDFELPQARHLGWGSSVFEQIPGVISQVSFESEELAQATISQWQEEGRIWFAEPEYRSQLFQTEQNPYGELANTYQNLNKPWHNSIRLPEAMQFLSQKTEVSSPVIAVLDAGMDPTHEAIRSNLWCNGVGQGFCEAGPSNPGVHTSANCGNFDIAGCNTTVRRKGQLGDGDIMPYQIDEATGRCPSAGGSTPPGCSHGQHVAGIIAAQSESANVYGVCPLCRIMTLKIVSQSEKSASGQETAPIFDTSIIRALIYLRQFRTGGGLLVRVINASFGKFQRSRAVSVIIGNLARAPRGALLIGAAGNEDTMRTAFPSGLVDAIAVSNMNIASDNKLSKSKSSNFGRWVDLAGPGSGHAESSQPGTSYGIYSTIPGNDFEHKSGTSMAAPVVAGVAGLILSVEPNLSVEALRRRILRTANPSIYDVEQHSPTNRAYFPVVRGSALPIPLLGSGMLDAYQAIQGEERNDLPINIGLDRVSRQCGQIADSSESKSSSILTWIVLLLPLIFIALFRSGHNLVKRAIDAQSRV